MKKITVLVIGLILFASNCWAQFPMKRQKVTDGSGSPSGYPSEVTYPTGAVTDDGDTTYTIDFNTAGGWTDGGANVYLTTGTDSVGIGTTAPGYKLDIIGASPIGIGTTAAGDVFNVGVSGRLTIGTLADNYTMPNDKGTNGQVLTSNGAGTASWETASTGGWTDDGTKVRLSTITDNVGIGTIGPTAVTHIMSTATSDLFKIEDNGAGDTSPVIVDLNGNLGIGTATTDTYKLWVNGDAYIGGITLTSGGLTFGGDLDMNDKKIINIGDTGTDFDDTGGLTLAGDLAVNGATTLGNGSDNVAVNTNQLYIQGSSGNVGIGTTAPGSNLVVKGTGATSATSSLNVTNSNDNSILFVRNDGRIGIGTTSPSGVSGGTASDKILHLVSSGDTYPTWTMERIGGSSFTNRRWAMGVANGGQWFWQDVTASANRLFIDTSGNFTISGSISGGTSYSGSGNITSTAGVLTISGTGNSSIAGNVGIGETAPGAKLSVSGGMAVGSSYDTTGVSDGQVIISGNVGIGTTAPQEVLHVVGNSILGTNDVVSGTAGTVNIVSSDTTVKPFLTVHASTALDYGFDFDSEQTSVGRMDLYGVIAGARTQIMSWRRTGNVGIGETAPGAKLSVSGGMAVGSSYDTTGVSDGQVIISGNVGIGTTAPQEVLHIVGNSILGTNDVVSGTAGTVNIVSSDTTVKPFLTVHASTALDYGFDFDSEQTSVGRMDLYGVIAGARTQIMSWRRTGNVGIGTTSPTSKLDLVGGVFRSDRDSSLQFADRSLGLYRNLASWLSASDTILFGGTDNGATAPAQWQFNTSGTGVVYINNNGQMGIGYSGTDVIGASGLLINGNVGIGTVAPISTLEVIESGVNPFLISNGVGGTGNHFIVNSAGNVGIGTAMPLAKLDIDNGAVAVEEITAPGTPPANIVVIYVDSADGDLKAKNDAGSIVTIADFP